MGFFNDKKRLEETFGIKTGETPMTRFIDNLDAVDVEMINWPDEKRLKHHFISFASSSWFEDFFSQAYDEDIKEAEQELLNGKILAQGLEGVQFSFRISGLSLHGSHAFVRNRIGICYLQQSQAVQDYRHADILVPRAYQKTPKLLEEYIQWNIGGKQIYADMLDSGEIAITDARFSYSKTVPVWIYTSMNLACLLGLFGKRTDTQEEHPEMNEVAYQLRDEVVKKFPWMKDYFREDTNCIHRFEGYRSNCVFARDEDHKVQNDNWTLHSKTKHQLMTEGLDPLSTRYFHGRQEISKGVYEKLRYGRT